MFQKLNNSKGFTLLEIIMVMAAFVGLAFLSVVTISSYMPHNRLKAAARDLVTNFQRAKMEAAKRNVNCTITFNLRVDAETYSYVVYVDADQDHEYDAGEDILSFVKLGDYKSGVGFDLAYGGGDGVDFDNNDNGRPSLAFNPFGLPINNGGASVTFRARIINDHRNTKSIEIGPAGRIRINS